jgi:hypothetical protein
MKTHKLTLFIALLIAVSARASDVTMSAGSVIWQPNETKAITFAYDNHDHLGRGILGADFALAFDASKFDYIGQAAVCPGACPSVWIDSASQATGLVAAIIYTQTPNTYIQAGSAVTVTFRNKTATLQNLCSSGFNITVADVGAASGPMSLDVAAWSCGETGGGCHGCELEKPTDLAVAQTAWSKIRSLYR